MKYYIPPDKACQETEHAACLLQGHPGRRVAVRQGKVARCDQKKSKIDKEEHQNVRDITGNRCHQKREDKHRPQNHEKTHGIVILRCIVAVGLNNPKGRSEQSTVARVEETYRKKKKGR